MAMDEILSRTINKFCLLIQAQIYFARLLLLLTIVLLPIQQRLKA